MTLFWLSFKSSTVVSVMSCADDAISRNTLLENENSNGFPLQPFHIHTPTSWMDNSISKCRAEIKNTLHPLHHCNFELLGEGNETEKQFTEFIEGSFGEHSHLYASLREASLSFI